MILVTVKIVCTVINIVIHLIDIFANNVFSFILQDKQHKQPERPGVIIQDGVSIPTLYTSVTT